MLTQLFVVKKQKSINGRCFMRKIIVLLVCSLLMCAACKHKNLLIGNEELKDKMNMGLVPVGCEGYFESLEADREKADKAIRNTCEKWAKDMFNLWQQTNIINKKAMLNDFRDSEYWKSIK
jgi:hypothetical protein